MKLLLSVFCHLVCLMLVLPSTFAGFKKEKKLPILLQQQSIETTEEGLSKLFDRMDTDKNQKLSMKEIETWVVNLYEKLAVDDAKLYISAVDGNKDGKLSWEEFDKHEYGDMSEHGPGDANHNADHEEIMKNFETDRKRMHYSDLNKDGQLTIDELKMFLHPSGYTEMTEFEAYRTLTDYDTSKDEFIDKDEYIKIHYGSPQISAMQKKQLESFFKKYDTDKDGRLNFKEITIWVAPRVRDYASEEAEHLMEITDTNKDGKLTKDEVLQHLGHWIDNKATDYGDVLREVKDEL